MADSTLHRPWESCHITERAAEGSYYVLARHRLPASRKRGPNDALVFFACLRLEQGGFRCRVCEVCDGKEQDIGVCGDVVETGVNAEPTSPCATACPKAKSLKCAAKPREWNCLITGLLFPLYVPCEHLDALRARFGQLDELGDIAVFDEDNKCERTCRVVLASTQCEADAFARHLCVNGADCLSVHRQSNIDGNITAINNKLRIGCYLVPLSVCDSRPNSLHLTALGIDEGEESDAFARLHPHIYRTPFRAASFDIETIVDRKRYAPNYTVSPLYVRNAAAISDRNNIHASTGVLLSHTSINPLDYGPITSIAVVLADTKPKRRYVFYNGQLAGCEPVPVQGSYWVSSHLQLVRCADEAEVIGAFLKHIESVTVLYAYNVEFDVRVIAERVSLYAATGRAELGRAWQRFLCKDGAATSPQLIFQSDTLLSEYRELIHVARTTIAREHDVGRRTAACRAANKIFMEKRDKMQTFRLVGFHAHIIDLYRLCHTQPITNACKDRKLDTVARHMLSTAKPNKNRCKIQKVGDVHYSEMDAIFTGNDGAALYRYLVYNATDAELVIRMVKLIDPVQGFLNRLRATKNIDIMHYGRGNYKFDGYVQSRRAVEVPLATVRLRIDKAVSLARGAEDRLMPAIYRRGQKIEIKGGYVAEPLTGLTFACEKQGPEVTLDFASLYPSNMMDANVGPDAVLDVRRVAQFRGWIVFDWRQIEEGFGLASLMYTPSKRRFLTTTTGSLNSYLSMRANHKQAMTQAGDNKALYSYHDIQQSEMKVCANSHYGVAPGACQVLITGLGRHKIKIVERFIKEAGFVHNYGDTDSVMFDLPCDARCYEPDIVPVVESEMQPLFGSYEGGATAEEWLCGAEAHVQDALGKRATAAVPGILTRLHTVLLDDFITHLRYVVPENGSLIPVVGSEHETWVRNTFSKESVTKLCFENMSTVTLRLQKKMYVNLTHVPLPNDPVGTCKVKARGMLANKSSAVGPERRIERALVNLIMKGGAIRVCENFERLEAVTWNSVVPGDLVVCTPGKHVRVCGVRVAASGSRVCREITFIGAQSVRIFEDRVTGISLNHLLSPSHGRARCFAFYHMCRYIAFATAAAFVDRWSDNVQFVYAARQTAYQRASRLALGLGDAKQSRIPFVKLAKLFNGVYTSNNVRKVKGCERQDPAAAFFHRYHFDTHGHVVLRDTIGAAAPTVRTGKTPDHGEAARTLYKHTVHISMFDQDKRTKLLAHALVEATTPTSGYNAQSFEATLHEARAAHQSIKTLAALGAGFHARYFNVPPPDIAINNGISIRSFFVRSTRKLGDSGRIPIVLYGEEFDAAARASEAYVKARDEAISAGVVEKVAEQRGICLYSRRDGMLRAVDDTGHPAVADLGRGAYLNTLFNENEVPPVMTRKRKREEEEPLGPPPLRATKQELCMFMRANSAKIVALEKTHCASCRAYWECVDIVGFVETEYAVSTDGIYTHRRPSICLGGSL
ncbi:ORF72 [Ranid herpesvirus 1]|uniref:DNA-directed DNA polymerase n=1 Tax=Ranid herpesvirus 1 TaxID=85655 RepID=Q9YQZ6_9VIRU|nr:ORF72 [Ranid herpesvirus 1]AAD12269.1 ORF72 [Ranid herpesvirus 1]